MLIVYVERWTGTDGEPRFPWSVWAEGRRLEMGGPGVDAADAERQALDYCRTALGRDPDRIEHL